eukprot:2231670-Amphidinium_carterae.1
MAGLIARGALDRGDPTRQATVALAAYHGKVSVMHSMRVNLLGAVSLTRHIQAAPDASEDVYAPEKRPRWRRQRH